MPLHAEVVGVEKIDHLVALSKNKIETRVLEVEGKVRATLASKLSLVEVKKLDPLESLMVSALAMEELNRKILAKRRSGESLEELQERVEIIFKNPRDVERVQVSFRSSKNLNQLREVSKITYASFDSMWKIELIQEAAAGLLPKAGWLEGVYEGMVARISTDLQSQGFDEYMVRSMKELLVGVALGFTGIATIPGVNWVLMGLGLWSMRHDVYGLVTNLLDGEQAGYHLGGIFKSLFTMLLGYGAGKKLNQLLLLLKKFPKLAFIAKMVEQMNKVVEGLSKRKRRGPYTDPPPTKKVNGKTAVTSRQPGVKLTPNEVINLQSGGKPSATTPKIYSTDQGGAAVMTLPKTNTQITTQTQTTLQTATMPEEVISSYESLPMGVALNKKEEAVNYVHTLAAYHAFKTWRKDFIAANQEVENKLTSIEALLKKAPYYVTSAETDEVQYLTQLPITNPKIKAALPAYVLAARKTFNNPDAQKAWTATLPSNSWWPFGSNKEDSLNDFEKLQKALAGDIQYRSWLKKEFEKCRSGKSNFGNELCEIITKFFRYNDLENKYKEKTKYHWELEEINPPEVVDAANVLPSDIYQTRKNKYKNPIISSDNSNHSNNHWLLESINEMPYSLDSANKMKSELTDTDRGLEKYLGLPDEVRLPKNGVILEIGGGNTSKLPAIVPDSFRYYSGDIVFDQPRFVNSEYGKANIGKLIWLEAHDIPMKTESVDLIILENATPPMSMGLLEEDQYLLSALHEMLRVLKVGGHIVSTSDVGSERTYYRQLEIEEKVSRVEAGSGKDDRYYFYYGTPEVIKKIK